MNYIGIDLGTTNSVGCIVRNGKFEYLKFHNSDLLPSAILYKDGKVSVGVTAKRKSVIYAEHYIASAKTYMGSDKIWKIADKTFTPTDVATEVLKTIYKEAKKFFKNDEDVEAVITTPAYFSGNQNEETRDAGIRAGFKVKQILAEPVAAALAYAFDGLKDKEKIYVVDLGGGTFDVSLLQVDGKNSYTTLMKDGDRRLGGDDFDKVIQNMMFSEIRKTAGINLDKEETSGLAHDVYTKTCQKLLTEAEKIKCNLSESDTEDVNIVNLFPLGADFYDLEMTITKDDFLREASSLVRKIENTIRHSFDDIEYTPEDVDRVILVGGSARMPFVRKFVEKFFNKPVYANKDLSKLVAMGAALLANDEDNTITLNDMIAHSLGIRVIGDRVDRLSIILKKNSHYPCENTGEYTTVHDYQESINVEVYEGECEEDINQNEPCGGFLLTGIEQARAGVPQIEVTFSFDESCILHVTAYDKKTGSQNSKNLQIKRIRAHTEG